MSGTHSAGWCVSSTDDGVDAAPLSPGTADDYRRGGPFKAVTARPRDDCRYVLARSPTARASFVRMRLTHKSEGDEEAVLRERRIRAEVCSRGRLDKYPRRGAGLSRGGRRLRLRSAAAVCLLPPAAVRARARHFSPFSTHLSGRRPGHSARPSPRRPVWSIGCHRCAPRCLTSRARVAARAHLSAVPIFFRRARLLYKRHPSHLSRFLTFPIGHLISVN